MPKAVGWFIFLAMGAAMLAITTYFAMAYGLLGLFAKVLCLLVLCSAVAGFVALNYK